MEKELILKRIDSFSELEENWNGYNGRKITETSILVAKLYLNHLLKNISGNFSVYPMPSGGIQYEIDDKDIEIEIHDYDILISDFYYETEERINWKNKIRLEKLKKIIGDER